MHVSFPTPTIASTPGNSLTFGASGVSLTEGGNSLYMIRGVTSRPVRAGSDAACTGMGAF